MAVKRSEITKILVKHLSRPQEQRYLVCQNDGCCIVCGHPFGTKEVRKRIGSVVNDIMKEIKNGE